MSSQNKKKSWTFVPKRSQPPANKRATRRETTLRAFTFVQDWDPKISPIPPSINNASQKKRSHKKDRNLPTSSQSSESSIRESPVAQLVRSSPGPIIVSRRIPGSGNSSFNRSHPLSPTPSISSQTSLSSKQHSSSKSLNDIVQILSEKAGASPTFSVPRTRKQHNESKKRSPVSQGEEEATVISPVASNSGEQNLVQDTDIASSSGVSNASDTSRLQESVIDTVGSSNRVQSRSSTAKKNKGHDRNLSETPNDVSKSQSSGAEGSTRSTRSRRGRGPSLTIQKKGRASPSFNAQDENKSISVLDSINETVPLDNEITERLHVSSASDDEHQATTTIPKKRQGSSLISKEGSAKGKTRQPSHEDDSDSTDVPVESDVPTPGSVRVSQTLSTASDRSRSTSPRKRRGPKLTFLKKSKKKLSTTPQDGEVNTEIYSSSSSSRTGSRRKISSKSSLSDRSSPEAVTKRKSPSLRDQKSGASSGRTPKGKRSSGSSRSDSSSSEADSRTKSRSPRGPRSGGSSARTPKGKPVSKKKNAASKIISKAIGKTPDRSMSFITATPKSGHVVRHQQRTQQGQRSGPVKAKGPAGERKRVVGTESSEPGEPVEKRAKVRLYTTGARPRLVRDTTDLDILFNCLEDTAMEFREALDAPRHRKAVSKFMEHAKHELTDRISMQHDFKLQTLSLSRTNSSIGRFRNELLDLQRGNTRLDIRIAEIKKEQEKSEDTRAKALKGIDLFVSDLENLHETYVSKYPKDIKSVEPVAQDNAETLSSELEPRLELQNTTGSLSDKLREWLGSQVLQK